MVRVSASVRVNVGVRVRVRVWVGVRDVNDIGVNDNRSQLG